VGNHAADGQALNRMPSSAVVTDRNDIAITITNEIGGADRPYALSLATVG
jgi:hypothetical protein